MLTDVLDWSGLLVDYCDVFISCLDSHSDGTHSLQRIHWWESDVMLHFSKSDEETNSSTPWMAWGWVHFQQIKSVFTRKTTSMCFWETLTNIWQIGKLGIMLMTLKESSCCILCVNNVFPIVAFIKSRSSLYVISFLIGSLKSKSRMEWTGKS